MVDLLSDAVAWRDGAAARLDARAKLALALAAIAAALASPTVVLPLAIAVACVAAALALGVPGRMLAWRILAPLGPAAVMGVLKALLTPGTPLAEVPLGSWTLILSREGAWEGLVLASRVMAGVSVLALVGSVTPAPRVFAALRWAGAPAGLVELAMLMYRYIFVLLDEIAEVRGAQRVRLGYAGVRRSLASASALAGTAILRALDQADRTHEAMRARAGRGTLPTDPPGPWRRTDTVALAGGLAILAAALLLAWRLAP